MLTASPSPKDHQVRASIMTSALKIGIDSKGVRMLQNEPVAIKPKQM